MPIVPSGREAMRDVVKATPNNKRVERRVPVRVITGPDPVNYRGTVLEKITGSSPVMTIGGEPGRSDNCWASPEQSPAIGRISRSASNLVATFRERPVSPNGATMTGEANAKE